jgi:hypothetical protein
MGNEAGGVVKDEHGHPPAKVLVPALVVGWAIIAFGAKSALAHAYDAHPFGLAVHVVGFDLFHDVVIAPVAVGLTWLIGRFVPPVARGPVRAALAASALFAVFAYPLVKRWGKRPTNSSTLPLEYGRNLAIIIAVIWILAAVVVVRRMLRARAT